MHHYLMYTKISNKIILIICKPPYLLIVIPDHVELLLLLFLLLFVIVWLAGLHPTHLQRMHHLTNLQQHKVGVGVQVLYDAMLFLLHGCFRSYLKYYTYKTKYIYEIFMFYCFVAIAVFGEGGITL